ncbi:hypothetical protein PSTT_13325 [Puccinia striiformis]|uniref:Uncharacterized protein n=1 Tax=Puccinia striiformis TaxID=27350 RepID=A0A2S4USB0_9BASI|nr:hypothetical protein PSTT_13325 [Puccinia striiformis]
MIRGSEYVSTALPPSTRPALHHSGQLPPCGLCLAALAPVLVGGQLPTHHQHLPSIYLLEVRIEVSWIDSRLNSASDESSPAPGSDAGLQGRRGSDNPPGINQAATSPSPASAALTPVLVMPVQHPQSLCVNFSGSRSTKPRRYALSLPHRASETQLMAFNILFVHQGLPHWSIENSILRTSEVHQHIVHPFSAHNNTLIYHPCVESNGRVVEPILDSSHMTTINDHPLSDTSQDFNDNDSAQWSVIDAFEPFSKTETIADTFKIIGSPDDHSATRNTGFKSPGSYPAFLHETQQLPGAFPLDRAETLTTYPPLKLPTDVCFIPSHDITPASSQGMLITIHSTLLHGTHGSFSSEVATRASKCLADFVNKTLLKLRHLSIVNKPDKRTPPHTIDGRTEFPAINSVNSKVGESGGTP